MSWRLTFVLCLLRVVLSASAFAQNVNDRGEATTSTANQNKLQNDEEATDTSALSYRETVSFIFNAHKGETGDLKSWAGQPPSGFNTLSDFDQANCTVHLRSNYYPRDGVVHLRGLTSWRLRPNDVVWELDLAGVGLIFEGNYYQLTGKRSYYYCTKFCIFESPGQNYRKEEKPDALTAAFDHLVEDFCPVGKLKF